MTTNKGLYLGTEIEENWRKRYTENNFFSRGDGQFWYDEKGFYFQRRFDKEPIVISFSSVSVTKNFAASCEVFCYVLC